MTSFLYRLAVLILFAIPSAHAEEATAPPTKPMPQLAQALKTMAAEIDGALAGESNLIRTLDRLETFEHTAPTQDLLEAALGERRPWRMERIKRVGVKNGKHHYRFVLPMLRHTLPEGDRLFWREFPVEMAVDASGRRLRYRGAWPEASLARDDSAISMHGLTVSGDQRVGTGKVWYGPMSIGVERLEVMAPDKDQQPVTVVLRDLRFDSNTVEKPKTIDIAQRFRIGRIEVANEEVRNLTMAYRFLNLDKRSMIELVDLQRKLEKEGAATDYEALGRTVGQFMRAAARANSTLVFERVGAEFGGHAFTMKGRIGTRGVKDKDFDDLPQLLKRIDARFELALPVALVRAVSRAVVERQQREAGNADSGPQVESAAKNMADMIVGKMTADGFARLDKGVLRSTVVLRGGKLTVNGKPVKLPTPPLPVKQDAAPVLPARRIESSCSMPEYPADVIARDAELTAGLAVLIFDDGQTGAPLVQESSGYPEFDLALRNALEQCKYLPAVENGKEVLSTLKVTITRAPGTTRPH